MADLTQVIRWNAGFVRGLAQSVLDRARIVRSTLTSYTAEETPAPKKSAAPAKKRAPSGARKKAAAKAGSARRKKTVHG